MLNPKTWGKFVPRYVTGPFGTGAVCAFGLIDSDEPLMQVVLGERRTRERNAAAGNIIPERTRSWHAVASGCRAKTIAAKISVQIWTEICCRFVFRRLC